MSVNKAGPASSGGGPSLSSNIVIYPTVLRFIGSIFVRVIAAGFFAACISLIPDVIIPKSISLLVSQIFNGQRIRLICYVILALYTLITVSLLFFDMLFQKLIINDKNIYCMVGVINRESATIKRESIVGVTVSYNFWSLLFDTGDIYLLSSGRAFIEFKGIRHPNRFIEKYFPQFSQPD